MNINEAKKEISNTIRAYFETDEFDMPLIPVEKRRPIFLMGPPGIGKSAIMEQIASEMNINLVSYTITHHTRQSTIGLPFIVKKNYGGEEISVTEYTMSEIIAAVYDKIEESGVKEGILFLDEINCVSETLAPTMLQFLQYKTFGMHKLPDSFVIVTAGNPPMYNKSVRDFDIVTLDRLKKIDVETDFDAWKQYAIEMGIHGSILGFLEIKKDYFYSIKTDIEDKYFVTARGWEDLSKLINAYEKLNIEINESVIYQYICDTDIASEFAEYYMLYIKYKDTYRIADILDGSLDADLSYVKEQPFDERYSLISLLRDSLSGEFGEFMLSYDVQKTLSSVLRGIRDNNEFNSVKQAVDNEINNVNEKIKAKEKMSAVPVYEKKRYRMLLNSLSEIKAVLTDKGDDYENIRKWFSDRENIRKGTVVKTGEHLTNAFEFINRTFGKGQEMVIFLNELTMDKNAVNFIRSTGNEAYYKYNKVLLLDETRKEILDEIEGI